MHKCYSFRHAINQFEIPSVCTLLSHIVRVLFNLVQKVTGGERPEFEASFELVLLKLLAMRFQIFAQRYHGCIATHLLNIGTREAFGSGDEAIY